MQNIPCKTRLIFLVHQTYCLVNNVIPTGLLQRMQSQLQKLLLGEILKVAIHLNERTHGHNNLKFKTISLNVRGISTFEKRKSIFNWLIKQNSVIRKPDHKIILGGDLNVTMDPDLV